MNLPVMRKFDTCQLGMLQISAREHYNDAPTNLEREGSIIRDRCRDTALAIMMTNQSNLAQHTLFGKTL